MVADTKEEIIENLMKYIDMPVFSKLLYKFQESNDYSDFIGGAIEIKRTAAIAACEFLSDKAGEHYSEKRWEKVDKSEDIYAKKKKESGIVDFKKD